MIYKMINIKPLVSIQGIVQIHFQWHRLLAKLMFKGPVLGLQKNWQPNWTWTDCNWTVVASPRGWPISPVVVAVA